MGLAEVKPKVLARGMLPSTLGEVESGIKDERRRGSSFITVGLVSTRGRLRWRLSSVEEDGWTTALVNPVVDVFDKAGLPRLPAGDPGAADAGARVGEVPIEVFDGEIVGLDRGTV
jgi:hypothetical protein